MNREYVGRHEARPAPITLTHDRVQAASRAAVTRPVYRTPRHEVKP